MQVQVNIMSCYSNKEKMESNDYKNICRNHSAKADRDMYRVCPSKLSKRELEDLYFTLLENNLELKKTINGQQDKIRVLSTQVQRMTNMQDKLVSKEMKDRGTATKAVVDEQKDFITELKETNQRLSDRIQHLNMRLCSAKQFMKTTPPQSAPSKGNRSSATAASTPKKHDCLSKGQESPERVLKVSTYSQWEEKSPRKDNQKQITVPLEKKAVKADQPCDENKCRTLMEDLKLKIASLQNELINVHGEYATRIGRLETEVLEVRKENIRVISERSASEVELTDTFKRAGDLLTQYRTFEAKCAELTTELAIERRKVAELETRLKAANMSDKVNKTIEDHLTTKQEASGAPDGGRKGGSPRKDGTRDSISRKNGTRNGIPRKDDIRDSIPRKDDTRDVSPQKNGSPPIGGPPDGGKDGGKDGGLWWWWTGASSGAGSRRGSKPRNGDPDIGSKDGGAKNGIHKDDIPKNADAKDEDGVPKDGDPKNGGPKNGGPKNGGPKNGIPKDGIPKDAGTKDKDVDPKNGVPKDGDPKNGGPKNGSPKNGIPKDGIPKDAGTKDKDVDPKNGVPDDGGPKNGDPKDNGPTDGGAKDDGPKDGIPKDDSLLTCKCGCPPPTPPLPPPPPAPAANEKDPIKALPLTLPPKKQDGLDDTSVKISPKCSGKSSSSDSKYSCNGRSYPTTATTSEETNCENCGCKFQLMSAVQSHTCSGIVHYYPIPAELLTGKCTMCGYTPQTPSESTSTPVKDKNNDVDCQCPAWVQDGSSKLSPSQDTSSKCMKCCFRDELLSMGSHPPRTHEAQSPRAGAASDPGDPSTTNTGDDSGYQDIDEQGLLKQNKELIAKILELQKQVDCLKIGGVCGMPGCSSENLSEFSQSPTKTADNSAVTNLSPLLEELPKASELPEDKPSRARSPDTKKSAPINSPLLLREAQEVETPVEQIEQSLKDENYENLVPVPSDQVYQPKKILRIEVLGNPKESEVRHEQIRLSEDTRAKTVEDENGTQYIADDPVLEYPDKYGYPDVPNKEHKERRWDSPKFEIEKKKREGNIAAISKHDPGNIYLKSATSQGPGPGFNPEKFKYLEAEGITAEVPRLIKKESLESIPSNPELGFGIPRLTSKVNEEKNKAETVSGQQKKSLGTSVARETAETSLPLTHPITSTQTDDTNKLEEDCQYCAACSYDNECTHGIKPTMDKLALEVQKERDKQHNSLQIPGPKLSSDNVKKEKKKTLFSHLKKQKKGNQSTEDLILDPRVYAKKTSDTVAGAVILPDVPLLEKRDQSTTDYMLSNGSDIVKKPPEKKDKSRKRKKGSQTKEEVVVHSRVYVKQTHETVGGPIVMADVPLLSRQEVGATNRRGDDSSEGKADTKQYLPEKSSQTTSFRDSSSQSVESPYRRRSGTYCSRARPPGQGPAACRCVGHRHGSCSHLPNTKGTQADTQENMSPREKRRVGPTSDRGTYTLDSKQTDTSPDNTDLEMSYLSDLPMEKEKKSPLKWRALSPGEARPASLSEGEVPSPTKRKQFEPDGDSLCLNKHLAHKLVTPPSQQMEAALQAISEELQRCKNLLHRQRPAGGTRMSTVS